MAVVIECGCLCWVSARGGAGRSRLCGPVRAAGLCKGSLRQICVALVERKVVAADGSTNGVTAVSSQCRIFLHHSATAKHKCRHGHGPSTKMDKHAKRETVKAKRGITAATGIQPYDGIASVSKFLKRRCKSVWVPSVNGYSIDRRHTSDTVRVGRARASTTMSAMSSMKDGSVFKAGTLEANEAKTQRRTTKTRGGG